MLNGVLVYDNVNNYQNIGDYIQSLAAKQFISDYPTFINRERLNEYSGRQVKLIMNGWFLHNPSNWPPSNKITPLFVSFHLNSKAYEMLKNENVISYFKKHAPIGCRDTATRDILIQHGIEAYFTGCLTLTLGETFLSKNRNDKIVIVDPFFEINYRLDKIFTNLIFFILNFKSVKKVNFKRGLKNSLRNLFKTANYFKQYLSILDKKDIINAIYVTHERSENDFESENDKFDLARRLIKEYSHASLIITSKIHCALPSLGLGTPVVFIENGNDNDISRCRFGGLLELFNVVNYTKGKFTSKDLMIENNKIKEVVNKINYIEHKNKLIEKCKKFYSE